MGMLSNTTLFLNNTAQLFLSVAKVTLQSKLFLKLPPKESSNSCIVLGNGPSLKIELENHMDFFIDKPLFGVSLFYKSDYYTQLKPQYYIISAPEHWYVGVNEAGEKSTTELYQQLAAKTTWPIYLFIPSPARKNKRWQDLIRDNKNIRVAYYNKTPIEGFQWVCNFFFKMGWGMPRPHNIVIPALMHAINMQYKEIYLAGVDHSWTKDIRVEDDNTTTMTHVHVYDKAPERMKIFGYIKEHRHLHDILMKFVHTFQSYFVIRKFAESQQCNIYNITKGSFIDAFERKNLG